MSNVQMFQIISPSVGSSARQPRYSTSLISLQYKIIYNLIVISTTMPVFFYRNLFTIIFLIRYIIIISLQDIRLRDTEVLTIYHHVIDESRGLQCETLSPKDSSPECDMQPSNSTEIATRVRGLIQYGTGFVTVAHLPTWRLTDPIWRRLYVTVTYYTWRMT